MPPSPPAPHARFVHEVWTVEDGLPVNSINAVLQSRDGYLWLATFDGLVRFDGARFTIYNSGNSAGLPSNRIIALIETRDGALWLRTEQNHLVRFRDGVFTHFDPEHGLEDISTTALFEDADGTLWVGTSHGVGYIRDDRFVAVAANAIDVSVNSVLRGADGTLWVGTSGHGLFRVRDGMADAIITTADGLPSNEILKLFEAGDGTLWIGTYEGASRLRSGELSRVLLSGEPWDEVIQEFHGRSADTVWIATEVGYYLYESGRLSRLQGPVVPSQYGAIITDAEGNTWYGLGTKLYRNGELVYRLATPDEGDPTPIHEIRALARDHEGSLWIGTNAGGLHRLKPALFSVYGEPEGMAHRNIYPVYEDGSGVLWFGTWGRGMSRLAGGDITNYTPDGGYPGFIKSIAEDRRGRLWLGTLAAGVLACTRPTMECAPPASSPLGDQDVFALHRDGTGAMWIGASEGLYRFRNGDWTHFGEDDGVPRAVVRAFLEARDGTLWMGTNGAGLLHYRDGRFDRVDVSDGLPSNLIRSLYQDADGWIWVGTEGRGLVRLHPKPGGPGAVTVYRRRDGLYDEVIHQILEDDFGRLWMSSNRGIFWVELDELNAFARGETDRVHSTAYTERDGLRNREANGGIQPAGVRAEDGRLWFPTQTGAVVVDPAQVTGNGVPPPVAIERVRAAERSIRSGDTAVALAAAERDFEIDYTALSFLAPENVRFRYRLEGLQEEWVDAGNRRTAFFTNVPPGEYTFRVIASNNAGVWNETGASLRLSVAPSFHERAEYRLLAVLALALVVVSGVRVRFRTLRRRESELVRLVDERTAELRRHENQLESQNRQLEVQAEKLLALDRAKSHFFTNVSHEFRTPLTLTIGPLEDVRAGLHGKMPDAAARQVGLALGNARRLLHLVNEVLDTAKLESGRMRLRAREADIVPFARRLFSAFTPAAERRRITACFDAPAHPVLVYFDAELLEKVLVNLLSNAFKFTPAGGRVALCLREEHEPEGVCRVALAIVNTGPGIPAEERERIFERFHQVDESGSWMQPGTGIGLSLARELVELHGGRIDVECPDSGGTLFTVRLPQGREHLRDDQIVVALPDEAPTPAATLLDAADSDVAGSNGSTPEAEDDDDVTTVLVVDDNAGIRDYVRSHLAVRYRVVEAASGAEGISLARRLLPDLVVSDVMMPDTDGYALCRALRADPETDFVPIILLTAKASVEHRVEGLDRGADDYLVKPFEMRELEARVANLIASRRRLRERFAAPPRLELHARESGATSADAAYLERVRSVIEAHLDDEEFGVAEMAAQVGQDRSHLYRRLRDLLGETPSGLIRRVRLERAAQLLAGRAGSVAEIAYGVGFNSVSYFCKCFREAYGTTPSAYRDGSE